MNLKNKLIPLATKLLINTLTNLKNNQITLEKQNDKHASYSKKIEKNDGEINWSKSAETINNKIRAYVGWPNSYTNYQNKRLTIFSAHPIRLDDSNKYKKIGEVCAGNNRTYTIGNTEEKISATVRCKNSELIISELQLENKNRMSIKDFLNGIISLDQCKEFIIIRTRQYAKRQNTWARGHMKNWNKLYSKNFSNLLKKSLKVVS